MCVHCVSSRYACVLHVGLHASLLIYTQQYVKLSYLSVDLSSHRFLILIHTMLIHSYRIMDELRTLLSMN